jgi:hypothetical protein
MTDSINFTPAIAQLLRNHYDRAVAEGDETFLFLGREMLTKYAKYLIEHLTYRGMLTTR